MTAVAVVVALLVPHGVDGSPWESVTASAPAVRVATTVQVAEPPPLIPDPVPPWARCGEWWPTARDVGWPEDQLPTLDYVMNRESHCNPGATGSNVHGRRAQGLTQLLGWDCPPNGCYDPTSNLAKALELWQRSGWRPWCLRGDKVTGSC